MSTKHNKKEWKLYQRLLLFVMSMMIPVLYAVLVIVLNLDTYYWLVICGYILSLIVGCTGIYFSYPDNY